MQRADRALRILGRHAACGGLLRGLARGSGRDRGATSSARWPPLPKRFPARRVRAMTSGWRSATIVSSAVLMASSSAASAAPSVHSSHSPLTSSIRSAPSAAAASRSRGRQPSQTRHRRMSPPAAAAGSDRRQANVTAGSPDGESFVAGTRTRSAGRGAEAPGRALPCDRRTAHAPHELHFSASSSSHGDVVIASAGQTSRHERQELLRYLVATHSDGVTSGRPRVEGAQSGVEKLEAIHSLPRGYFPGPVGAVRCA